jgi:hypothetical protein
MSPTVRVLNKLRRHSGPAGILSKREYAIVETAFAEADYHNVMAILTALKTAQDKAQAKVRERRDMEARAAYCEEAR